MTPEQQLQLALAKELPELIDVITGNQLCQFPEPTFWWKDGTKDHEGDPAPVTPREWDWIMRECEKKLEAVAPGLGTPCRSEYLRILVSLVGDFGWEMTTAPWPTRALAYFKTTKEEIK